MIRKLQSTPAIYLVGFMGSGKSTIGRLLADKIGWSFADLDEDIEAGENISVAEIFETRGEAVFRQLETQALRERVREVQCAKPTVLAMGGGAFVQPENFDLVAHSGVTVWLDCPLPALRARVEKEDHRPLARDPEEFEQLYHARRESYARAEYRVEIKGDDPEAAVNEILRLPIFD
jgi:shikimate kinase